MPTATPTIDASAIGVSMTRRSPNVGLAERNRIVTVGHLAFDQPIRFLVLQEEHRVGIVDGGVEQTLDVVGKRRRDDF